MGRHSAEIPAMRSAARGGSAAHFGNVEEVGSRWEPTSVKSTPQEISAFVGAILGFEDDAGFQHFDAVPRSGGYLYAYVAALHISIHFSRVIISPSGSFILMIFEISIW